MATGRVLGGGDAGLKFDVTCVPDATFKSEIDALIAAGTEVIAKKVSFTFSNDYEVTSPADDAIYDGYIVEYEKDKASPYYYLTVRLCHYTDQNSGDHTPVCIHNSAYSGTIALQDSVIINGTTYINVDDGGTGGWGAVIAKDNPASGYVDILF